MSHDERLAQAEIYALGALDGDERLDFEEHLASGCPDCARYIHETEKMLALLPRSLPRLTPPPRVKARLLEQISGSLGPGIRPRWRVWPGRLAQAITLAAACLLAVMSWSLWTTRQELQRRIGQVEVLQEELARRDAILHLIADPDLRPISLAGQPTNPGAAGRLLWSPSTREGILLTSGLPQPPAGKAYELWAIAGKDPVPAGVFTVDRGGRGVLHLPPLPKGEAFNTFAVTLEPATGSQTPTPPLLLAGTL
jgi:anti-sigma-K factor RskA